MTNTHQATEEPPRTPPRHTRLEQTWSWVKSYHPQLGLLAIVVAVVCMAANGGLTTTVTVLDVSLLSGQLGLIAAVAAASLILAVRTLAPGLGSTLLTLLRSLKPPEVVVTCWWLTLTACFGAWIATALDPSLDAPIRLLGLALGIPYGASCAIMALRPASEVRRILWGEVGASAVVFALFALATGVGGFRQDADAKELLNLFGNEVLILICLFGVMGVARALYAMRPKGQSDAEENPKTPPDPAVEPSHGASLTLEPPEEQAAVDIEPPAPTAAMQPQKPVLGYAAGALALAALTWALTKRRD